MTAAANAHTSTVGYVIECRGAWVRTQMRSVASVITVTGRLDETNVELVTENLCRFSTLGSPLVVDLSGSEIDEVHTCDHLVHAFGANCARRGVDWVVVAPFGAGGPAWTHGRVPCADSVAEALQHFVLSIHARRTIPLARGPGSLAGPTGPCVSTGRVTASIADSEQRS
jgi:hypothetical protein